MSEDLAAAVRAELARTRCARLYAGFYRAEVTHRGKPFPLRARPRLESLKNFVLRVTWSPKVSEESRRTF